ncbi:MAG: hypothetical protein V3T77_05375, partial [Planctomycetota bacterium]
ILDGGETAVPGSATLHYRSDPMEPFSTAPMNHLGGVNYVATLPAAACGDAPDFYFSAQGDGGTTVFNPISAPQDFYSSVVGMDKVFFTDDLETDQGWSVGDVGDSATTGTWVRINPNGTAAQPEDDHTPDSGQFCWVTGQGSVGGSIGENDVDGGKTTLKTPIIDLEGEDATIAYWRWYSNDEGSAPGSDVFVVDISNNGGGTWVTAEIVGPGGSQASGEWFFHEFTVSEFVTPTDQIMLRFVASDEGTGSIVEAAVDDFQFSRFECPCEQFIRGDTNSDLTVNIADATFLLLHLFQSDLPPTPEEAGDINDDDETNVADVIYLLNYLFQSGSPPPAPFPDPECE